jgi:diaminohydroxyphosphoribosylaminopyrimidine deaminase / 5-amino-6-(5-phosphoribosylamino)uracil reductase
MVLLSQKVFMIATNPPDHAEVVALKIAGEKARGATMYVTLEPCNHTGTTAPCTQAIIDAGIKSVVYAVTDPNTVAAGGAAALKAAGIEVVAWCWRR